MTEKVIELADQFIGSHETYREAKIVCEKLFRQSAMRLNSGRWKVR